MSSPGISRHAISRRGVLTGAAMIAAGRSFAVPFSQTGDSSSSSASGWACVHTFSAGPAGLFVNAYAVETSDGVVVIDGTLRVSDAMKVREGVRTIGKPLRALLLTHAHPDHYAGLAVIASGTDAKIVSTAPVAEVVRKEWDRKNNIASSMLGAEWPSERRAPDTLVESGTVVEFDGVGCTVRDIGVPESDADSVWTCSALPKVAFSGDIFYSRMHGALFNGTTARWLNAIEKHGAWLKKFDLLFPGHGGAADPSSIEWQKRYIQTFRERVRELANGKPELSKSATEELASTMKSFAGSDRLIGFLEVSANPVAAELVGLHRPGF